MLLRLVKREKWTRTAGTLVATRNAMLDSVMMALQATRATVGRRSKSLGHKERGKSELRVVLLYVLRVSPAVPMMVMDERRASAVKPKPTDSTTRRTPAFCGLGDVGGLYSLVSHWISGFISGSGDVMDMVKDALIQDIDK